MPEMTYKEFDSLINVSEGAATPKSLFPVYLIFGEELLVKKAHESIVSMLLPGNRQKLNLETIAGDTHSLADVIQRMSTYSLLSGTKVVSLQDARIFDSHQSQDKLLDKAKTAWQNEDHQKAAAYVLSCMAQIGLKLEDFQTDGQAMSLLLGSSSDDEWISALIEYCRENDLRVPENKDYAKLFQEAVTKGFPKKNHLIITSEMVDRRRELYHCLKEHGLVVDCSIPKGSRQADQKIQAEVLRERMQQILSASQKRMEPRAFEMLYEMTGFDLRTFSGNIEKLVLFVGNRDTITAADVSTTLDRTREDPIFELTGAVSDRNLESAMFFLSNLLSKGAHPLQILAALINHFRRLILMKAFTESALGSVWKSEIPYNRFVSDILPAIKRYDAQLLEKVDSWDAVEPHNELKRDPGDKKKKKKNIATEVVIAQTAGNPYPIYLMLKKTDRFTLLELLKIYAQLGDTDVQLKSSGHTPRILLEALMINICAGKI